MTKQGTFYRTFEARTRHANSSHLIGLFGIILDSGIGGKVLAEERLLRCVDTSLVDVLGRSKST